MAEVAEDRSPGRIPRMGAPTLSIHAFKIFGARAKSSAALRALAGALRVLRVDRLLLQFSAPPRTSAASA